MARNIANNNDTHTILRRENVPTHSEDGVDLTLIRWMLSLTPNERLEILQQNVRAILELRDANPDL